MRRIVVSSLVALVACGHEQEIQRRYVGAASTINAHYDELQRSEAKQWDDVIARIEKARKWLVDVGGDGAPVHRVTRRPDLLARWQPCVRLKGFAEQKERVGRNAAEQRQQLADCEREYQAALDASLRRVYFRADFLAALEGWKAVSGQADYEALLAGLHNDAIALAVASGRANAEAGKKEETARLEELRRLELAGAQQTMEAELEADRENSRRVALAIAGAALQGAAAAAQQSAVATAPATVDTSCTSDFACGVGKRCVKPNYSSTGTCMRSVDEYGLPQYTMPATGSVGIKTPAPADCHFGTDCPIGFRCDTRSGACVK